MADDNTEYSSFQKVALATVVATIFLIFVGGLVRAAGAGLGCPDWPKCFGMWIPPISASELPAQFDITQFNVFKTWTEYVNRLIGIIIGLLITATFLLSLRYRKTNPAVVVSSGAAFVLVLVQGWLGGQVVLSGLDEWLITIHMLLAMIIMMVLIYAVFKASSSSMTIKLPKPADSWLLWTVLFLLISTLIQLVLGTQVREIIDVIKGLSEAPPREIWISRVGLIDEVHRSFSWVILIAGAGTLYLSYWWIESGTIKKMATTIFGLILLQITTGIGLYYLGFPPVYQVVHLTGVAVLLAFEFLMFLIVIKGTDKAPNL